MLNLTYTPPYDEAAWLRIDADGIYYNDSLLEEKIIILKTNIKENARGITFGITNMENWIDVVTLALKNEIRFVSLTHEGTDEKWFRWNDKGHKHDECGQELRYVNETN